MSGNNWTYQGAVLKYVMRRFFVGLFCVVVIKAETVAPMPAPASEGTVRVGLALSGGAALGLAHIGVLKVLEEEGIGFVAISGNSMGSMVGGVYAAGYSAAQIESIALSADWDRLFSSRPDFGALYLPERQQAERYILQLRHRRLVPYLPAGLVPLQNVEFLLNRLLAEIEFHTGYDFDSLPIPYRAVAVDIKDGQLVVLRRGRLEQAIRASIAIPGVFAPEVIDGVELVDGGVMEYLPVKPLLEFSPDFIIAVLTMRQGEPGGAGLIDVASRSVDLMGRASIEEEKQLADVVIEPDVSRFLHSDFPRARELIAAGESAARAALPLIREKLKGRETVKLARAVRRRELPVVADVQFAGLVRTRESLLRREIKTRPGAVLDFSVLLRDIERLFNTRLFEDVNFRLASAGDNQVVVVFEVSERAYGFYSLGVRYDNYDNVVVGVEVGEENLWGTGAAVRVAGIVGNPNEVRLGLTGTKIFNLPFGYRLDGFACREMRAHWEEGRFQANYFVGYAGGVAEAGYVMGRNGFFNLGWKTERVSYQGAVVESLAAGMVSGPLFNLEFNSYDDIYLPRRGLLYRLNGLYGYPRLGSRKEFLRFHGQVEDFLPLGSVLSLRMRAELGFTLGELEFAEFLRNGVELVGFAPDEWTVRQKVVLGAGVRLVVFRLFNRDGYPVYLDLFANAGNFSRWDSVVRSPAVLDNWHWGAGAGVSTITPLGPVSFNVALGDFLKKPPHPGGVRFWVALGREFRYHR